MKNKHLIIMDLDMKKYSSFEEYFVLLAKRVSDRGDSIHFVLPKEPCPAVSTDLVRHGATITVLKRWWKGTHDYNGKRNMEIVFSLLKLRPWNFDMIHLHFCSEKTGILLALLLKLLRHKNRMIWYEHSTTIIQARNNLMHQVKRNFGLITILSHLIDKIIAVSNAGRNDILTRSICTDKVLTIHNGIDPEKFKVKVNSNDIRKELSISNDALVITNVGGPRPEKGISCLLEAAKTVIKTVPNACFLIVGHGALSEELKQMARQLGIDKKIYFLGLRQDIPDILRSSDIFALPSLREAFPISILEAMAMSLPVVASKVGGISEQVIDRKNGFLVPPNDPSRLATALITLATDKEMRLSMGKSGYEMMKDKFTINNMVNETLSV